MTMLFVLGAVTEQRDRLFLSEVLEQSEGELLAVVLDPVVAGVRTAGLRQFLYVTPAVFAPRYFAGQNCVPQLLARTKVRHPDVETIRRQTTAAPARRQDPEAVSGFDRTGNRLGLKHGFGVDLSARFWPHQLGIINCLQSPQRPHILEFLLNHNL
jgi:hypothetical protein